jgi:type IV pilus assembly protein PilN
MIRINLLAVERERTKRRALIPAAQRVTIAASLILVGAVLLVGWWYWSLSQQSTRVDEDIAKAELETQQLRAVLEKVRSFETQKAQLQQRVTLIEQLRRGQTGPVHVLDEISKGLPERLWLTEMSQKGDDFTISGQTTSLSDLSDFVAALEGSTWFKKPVDIINSEVEANPKGIDLFKFSLKATVNSPDAPPPVPAKPATAAARTAAGK